MTTGIDKLTVRQRQLLEQWLPDAAITKHHSWNLIGTTVLELVSRSTTYILKAGDEHDHHIARELRAHRKWLEPWISERRAPRLLFANDEARLLVRQHLPGVLVEGTPHEFVLDTYQQAGELLARLHGQFGIEDTEFEAQAKQKALDWLNSPHRIAPDFVVQLRTEIESWPNSPVILVPTHGDWQPRNWLVNDGFVSVIDFGRSELRPAITDFARLSAQQFRGHLDIETAFFDGYGEDAREPLAWRRVQVREAVGTAAWAYQVANEPFERQGHRMIAEALSRQ